jgi:hypothetical protein
MLPEHDDDDDDDDELLKSKWLCDAPTSLTIRNFTFCHTAFTCLCLSENKHAT